LETFAATIVSACLTIAWLASLAARALRILASATWTLALTWSRDAWPCSHRLVDLGGVDHRQELAWLDPGSPMSTFWALRKPETLE